MGNLWKSIVSNGTAAGRPSETDPSSEAIDEFETGLSVTHAADSWPRHYN